MAGRILIVDDNLDLSANLADIFQGAPELEVSVTCVTSGQQGVWEARHGGFDVAIVDVKLPDMSGVDLIRLLRTACPYGEIILITGFATVDTTIAALRAGAFAFILKSFRPEELISTVEQALEKVSLKREREDLERRYRAMVDAADLLIVALDPQDRVALFNPRIAHLARISATAAIGDSFVSRYIPEEDQARLTQAIAEARSGDKATEVESGFAEPSTPNRRIRWHLSGVREPHGGQDLVYGIGIDITERRELERRAADAEALSVMGSLALGLAHEIRNPLNAAVLQLHLLGRGVDRLDDASARHTMRSRVAIVEEEIGRLERLLTEFLELARPRGIRSEVIDVARLVRDVLDFQAEALATRHIELALHVPTSCSVRGDPEKLRQVFINLVVNALEAMPDGGVLKVCVQREGGHVIIEVSDSGPGIDPKILPDIFNPFFTTKEAGTGLGLSIVRKIVDQHGGQVAIASQPGQGTAVKITLAEEPSGARAPSGAMHLDRGTRG